MLLYREIEDSINPYICVVVHTEEQFILTAYMTSRPRDQASSVS